MHCPPAISQGHTLGDVTETCQVSRLERKQSRSVAQLQFGFQASAFHSLAIAHDTAEES